MTIIIKEIAEITVEEGDTEILIQTIPDGTLPGEFLADHGSLSGLADDDHPQYIKRTETLFTNAEIKAAYEANANTNAFTDADAAKLDGIEPNATQDQTAAEIKGLLGISGTVVGTTDNQTLTNKVLTDSSNDIHANLLHTVVKNNTGSTLFKGQAVAVSSYVGGELIERVVLADNTTAPANYILEEDIANGETGDAITAGILDAIDTTGDAVNNFCADISGWAVKDILYVNGSGKLTKVAPTTGYVQPIAMVIRSHATEGALHILAADPRNAANSTVYGHQLISEGDGTAHWGLRVWKDITGIYLPDSGAALPTVATFKVVNTKNIDERMYGAGDASDWKFHIPHDWAIGTDMYIHIHWGHNGTNITGSMIWDLAWTFAPRTVASGGGDAFVNDGFGTVTTGSLTIGSFPQFSHVVEEIPLSTAAGTSNTLVTGNITVDGVVIVHVEAATIPTITDDATLPGTTTNPFLFFVDIHYQADVEGTKNKDPNFYV